MAIRAPVVTSRTSSMPKVAGGAAVLVDPLDVAGIARGIDEGMRRRRDLVAAGQARVNGRTWRDLAGDTINIYEWAWRRDMTA